MQAKDFSLNEVLQERQQWVVPVYQRNYTWETGADGQLPKLWDDLRDRAQECLDGGKPKPHFVGAIIYSQPSEQPFGTVSRRFLVDGQQRITTFSLVLCAMKEVARERGFERPASAIEGYLFNAQSASMADPEREQFKLWSSSFDRPYYVDIARMNASDLRGRHSQFFFKNGNLIWGKAPKILASYWFIRERIQEFLDELAKDDIAGDRVIDALLTGFLTGFQIVVVQLGQQDDAQAIFGSLNGNAAPLTSFDLIRNDIFHRARKVGEDNDQLYDLHWKELETEFWKEEIKQGRLKRPRTDHLVVHTMVAETADEIIQGQVANAYRSFATKKGFMTVAEEVRALLKYAQAYQEMELGRQNGSLAKLARFLHVWDTSAMHPLVLWTAVQDIDQARKNEIYRLIESYMVRRDLCDLGNRNYNKVVVGVLKEMHQASDPLDAFVGYLTGLTGEASRFPNDTEVVGKLPAKPLYQLMGSKKLRYILTAIERKIRIRFDENVPIIMDDLTVEHIMPANWSANWALPSGAMVTKDTYFDLAAAGITVDEETRNAMDRRELAKHTLGNLTLLNTSLNPSIGNDSWAGKKPRIARSLLALNRDVADHVEWNEATITARTNQLGAVANELWAFPVVRTAAAAAG